jgi:hypothetical protein
LPMISFILQGSFLMSLLAKKCIIAACFSDD